MTNRTSARVLASMLALACSGAVGVAAQGEKKGAQIDETKLEKRPRKVECIGNTTVSLVGVSLRLQDVAIEATGGCKVVIRNSHISGSVAIQLVRPAEVTIEN